MFSRTAVQKGCAGRRGQLVPGVGICATVSLHYRPLLARVHTLHTASDHQHPLVSGPHFPPRFEYNCFPLPIIISPFPLQSVRSHCWPTPHPNWCVQTARECPPPPECTAEQRHLIWGVCGEEKLSRITQSSPVFLYTGCLSTLKGLQGEVDWAGLQPPPHMKSYSPPTTHPGEGTAGKTENKKPEAKRNRSGKAAVKAGD